MVRSNSSGHMLSFEFLQNGKLVAVLYIGLNRKIISVVGDEGCVVSLSREQSSRLQRGRLESQLKRFRNATRKPAILVSLSY